MRYSAPAIIRSATILRRLFRRASPRTKPCRRCATAFTLKHLDAFPSTGVPELTQPQACGRVRRAWSSSNRSIWHASLLSGAPVQMFYFGEWPYPLRAARFRAFRPRSCDKCHGRCNKHGHRGRPSSTWFRLVRGRRPRPAARALCERLAATKRPDVPQSAASVLVVLAFVGRLLNLREQLVQARHRRVNLDVEATAHHAAGIARPGAPVGCQRLAGERRLREESTR